MPTLKVVPLHEVLVSDITGMLRQLAGRIERGELENVTGVVVMPDAPGMPVSGFGNLSAPAASELLACAHHRMIRGRLIGQDALEL
ncbi:hypothetical protein [Paraburkholderia dinghuensis]|uniref:Uncharacterized protein n=1 Tax=Paraburkholderia dinghuensis TaxID=2305225 RepID=A0A3N6MMD6_9BURK|nr:hypothetical protein [Paraburkholderia dinghuensis]RQH02725.1 hypothetical protein D1Y85_21570 [Paraburkholderia dinghuensis]